MSELQQLTSFTRNALIWIENHLSGPFKLQKCHMCVVFMHLLCVDVEVYNIGVYYVYMSVCDIHVGVSVCLLAVDDVSVCVYRVCIDLCPVHLCVYHHYNVTARLYRCPVA